MVDRAGPARRRPSEEVRGLILESARESFIANGYQATRVKDIAERAGVQERLLFTNFGSKAALFSDALVEPLRAVVDGYLEVKHAEHMTIERRLKVFIDGLFAFAWTNRTELRLILGSIGVDGTDNPGADLFDQIAQTLRRTLELGRVSEHPEVDSTAAMIDLAGMVFGVALLDDMLVPRNSRRPSQARLLDEMTKMATYRLLYPSSTDTDTDDTQRPRRRRRD